MSALEDNPDYEAELSRRYSVEEERAGMLEDDWRADQAAEDDYRATMLEQATVAYTATPESSEVWDVRDDAHAAALLRRIARRTAELERIHAAAQLEITALRAWEDEASTPLANDIKADQARLINYRLRLEATNPKLPRTYKLPGGNLTRTAGRPSTDVTDPTAFIAWASVHEPEAVKRSPLKSVLTESGRYKVNADGAVVAVATGEIVPGVKVKTGDDTYAVKLR